MHENIKKKPKMQKIFQNRLTNQKEWYILFPQYNSIILIINCFANDFFDYIYRIGR